MYDDVDVEGAVVDVYDGFEAFNYMQYSDDDERFRHDVSTFIQKVQSVVETNVHFLEDQNKTNKDGCGRGVEQV